MIAIVNITQPCEPGGIHTYSLRVNRREICQFEHERSKGLAACLMAAAMAAEKQQMTEYVRLLDELNSVDPKDNRR
jgi:hypothetical protein